MFGAKDRLTQLALLEQLTRLTDRVKEQEKLLKELRRDLDSALDVQEHRKAGELIDQGISNLLNYAGAPARKKGERV